MSNFTKRALADALRELLKERTLDKITVQQITDRAGVSRKTFYYHFQDVLDLMEWELENEARIIVSGRLSQDNWQQKMEQGLEYLLNNRASSVNLFKSLSRDIIDDYLLALSRPIVSQLMQQEPRYDDLTPKNRETIIDMYCFAADGLILQWAQRGMREPPQGLTRQMSILFTGTMRHAVDRMIKEQITES